MYRNHEARLRGANQCPSEARKGLGGDVRRTPAPAEPPRPSLGDGRPARRTGHGRGDAGSAAPGTPRPNRGEGRVSGDRPHRRGEEEGGERARTL